jgi:hypothetical protein
MNPFVERHQSSISSTFSCFDRVVVTGTLPDICHPRAMAGFLDYHKVRLFDFPHWAEPLREELRKNAERIAAGAGLQIELIFIDEQFALCYVRVPTWAPFRLQIYFNGHSWLARQLLQAGIPFEMADDAFVCIADPEKGQALADSLNAQTLHERLALWAQRFCPVLRHFRSACRFSSSRSSTPPTCSCAAKPNSSPPTRRSCAPPCT